MKIFKILLAPLLLTGSLSSFSEIYNECYSKKDGGDFCVKHEFSAEELPEKFSKDFFDKLIDDSGRTFGDAVISGAKSYGAGIGAQLAQQALLKVAEGMGLDLLVGILGGGPRGPSQIELIDEMLSYYSTNIINEVKLSEDHIVNVIQQHCSGAAGVDYRNINTQLNMFYADTLDVKKEPHNLSSLNDYIYDLGRLREEYGTVDNDYCFFGSHPEYFYWFTRLVSTEIETIIARENIEYENQDDFHRVLIDTLETVIANDTSTGGVQRTISELESSDPEDSNNEWQYEIERNFSDVRINELSSDPTDDPTKYHCPGYVNYDTGLLSESENEVIQNILNGSDRNSRYWDNKIRICNNLFSYTYDGIHYSNDYIALWSYTDDGEGNIVSGLGWTMPRSAPFLNITNSEVKVVERGASKRDHLPFAVKAAEEHKKYAYAKLLQQTYQPYQAVLDYWWDLVGMERPTNKMDREVLRTSALSVLDNDGLSVVEEIELGTSPRNDDTDGDGFDDGFEFYHMPEGFEPTAPHDAYSDADGDGAYDLEEYAAGTDMFDYDDNPAQRQRLAAILVPIIALILH